MLRQAIIASALALSTAAIAEDAPTVTLTAQELQAIVASEIARAHAQSGLQKVQAAFAPKLPAKWAAPKEETK